MISGSRLKKIKMLIMDVDGTLTDGKIYIGLNGEILKAFNVKDGYGIKLLKDFGIKTVIITGRTSEIVCLRAKELGIDKVYQGIDNKIEKYYELKQEYNLNDEEIAYIGDDINDIGILRKVGCKFAVKNCTKELDEIVDYKSEFNGGDGAVREIATLILEQHR
ncbi:KdsC family phosphatase [Sutcliffiella horikoshii]|uniref:KdsC family phosphatase n=1 Tax=Sutcliffiella horikoshii TaxID=79883 RepID=UPI001CFD491F|nr:HAD-IIIA family hydrolase [Sutcliffiella horikoshii]